MTKLFEWLKSQWRAFKGMFYLYDWLKPIVCRIWGHKIKGQYMIYEQEKLKKKGEDMLRKKRYDPYMVYSCARCGKKLGTKRLKRKMKRGEVAEFTKRVAKVINKTNNTLVKS